MSFQDLELLTSLFERQCAMNRQALAALRARGDLAALRGLFEDKAKVLADCVGLLGSLSGASARDEGSWNVWKDRLLRAQRDAMVLETQLIEALRNSVPRFGKVLEAYNNGANAILRQSIERHS